MPLPRDAWLRTRRFSAPASAAPAWPRFLPPGPDQDPRWWRTTPAWVATTKRRRHASRPPPRSRRWITMTRREAQCLVEEAIPPGPTWPTGGPARAGLARIVLGDCCALIEDATGGLRAAALAPRHRSWWRGARTSLKDLTPLPWSFLARRAPVWPTTPQSHAWRQNVHGSVAGRGRRVVRSKRPSGHPLRAGPRHGCRGPARTMAAKGRGALGKADLPGRSRRGPEPR